MLRTLAKIGLLIALIVVASRSFHLDLDLKLLNLSKTQLSKGIDQLKTIEERLVLPPPLRGPTQDAESQLTVAGVIADTNARRKEKNTLPLKQNEKLTKAAEAKVDDMFARQYFEHESPTGESVDDLARETGYEYLIVGENLALGNYENDQTLVQAWMDSPGHRDNLLNPKYTEIGVAVKRGTFEGRTVWLAVQEFGRPSSLCPSPSSSLKQSIETNRKSADTIEAQLEEKREELEDIRPRRGATYNQKVTEYNALVERYNTLINTTKQQISNYNNQVNSFNLCIES